MEAVSLVEVGPRDGLQNESRTLPPTTRAAAVRRLAEAGLRRIEVASFVSEARVPQMAGAEEVVAASRGIDAIPVGLVLNPRGLERALAAGLRDVSIAQPLTSSFGRRNQGVDAETAGELTGRLVRDARGSGLSATVTLSVAFGCPFEGPVADGVVVAAAARAAEAGATAVVLADTIGVAAPRDVRRLLRACRPVVGTVPLGLHLHNTRNAGYACALAGVETGVRLFDASVGGIGGCPFAPRATGNVATEDLAWLLEREGMDTGVDLDRLCEVTRWLGGELGRDLPGLLHRAGPWPPADGD